MLNYAFKSKITKTLFVVLFLVVSLIFYSKPAKALTNNGSYLPPIIANTNPANSLYRVANCDRNWAQFTWISDANDSTGLNQFSVPYGTDSKALSLRSLTSACDQNINFATGDIVDNSLQKTTFIFDGVLTAWTTVNGTRINFSTSGLSQNLSAAVDMSCTNYWNLRFAKQCFGTGLETADPNRIPVSTPISIGGLSQLGSGTYTISMQYTYYAVNNYPSGAKCVGYDELSLSSIFYLRTRCKPTSPIYNVVVTIPPPDAGILQTYKYLLSNSGYSDRFTSAAVAYGSEIPSGTKLISSNGGFEAIWDENKEGQLKVYDLMGGGRVLQQAWGPKSTSTITNKLCLQDDANLVIRQNYCAKTDGTYGPALWAVRGLSSTNYWSWERGPAAYTNFGSATQYYLKMQDDGNLTVYNTANSWTDTSNTLRIGGLNHYPATNTPSVVAGASVSYLDANGNVFYTGTDNPAYRSNVYVAAAPFTARVVVPKGYNYASSFVMDHLGNRRIATPNATCTPQTDGTDICNIGGIYIDKNVKTTIDFVMQPEPPVGSFDDVCNIRYGANAEQFYTDRNLTSKDNASTKTWGWVYDSALPQTANDVNTTPSTVVIKFDQGKSTEQAITVKANAQRDDVAKSYPAYGKYHGFVADVPEMYFDNTQHTAKAYIDRYGTGNLTQIKNNNTNYNDLTFTCPSHYFPWLQTKQGDVVSDGHINGQFVSLDGVTYPGARPDSATNKEAEFLVISAVAGKGLFCSTYNYILTNTAALNGLCTQGTGYNFNSTAIDLFNTNNTTGKDRVITGVSQAFSDNGNNTTSSTPAACSAAKTISTATLSSLPTTSTTDLSTSCTGGVIYKLSSNSLGNVRVNNGRVTIFVDGDLYINGSINLGTTAQADPRLAPSVAIVVNGNVGISSGIGQVNATIYSTGKVNTCTTSNATDTNTPSICSSSQLSVNGSLVSKSGFDFKRTFINTTRDPAELITLRSQYVTFPPPGIESRYFYNDFSSYKLDTAEYQPRF